MDDRAPAQIPGPGQVALLVSARGQDFELLPLGQPLVADFGEQADIKFIGKEHRGPGWQVLDGRTNTGQLLYPLRVIILGGQLRSLPYPAQLVQPAAHGLSRNLHAPACLQLQGQRCATPARPAPPTRPRHHPEQGQQGPLQRGRQHPRPRPSGPFGGREVESQRPGAVRLDDPIDTGAGAKQYSGNLAGGAPCRTQEPQLESQQIAIASAAQLGHPLGLLSQGDIHYRHLGHRRSSLMVRFGVVTSNVSASAPLCQSTVVRFSPRDSVTGTPPGTTYCGLRPGRRAREGESYRYFVKLGQCMRGDTNPCETDPKEARFEGFRGAGGCQSNSGRHTFPGVNKVPIELRAFGLWRVHGGKDAYRICPLLWVRRS